MSEKEMIEEFLRWCNANDQRFRTDSVRTELRRPGLATVEQAGINLETEYVLASINIWGWGDFEVIVMCKRTKEAILSDDFQISSPTEVFGTLECYYNRVVNQPPC